MGAFHAPWTRVRFHTRPRPTTSGRGQERGLAEPAATKTTGPAGGGPKPFPSGPQIERRSPAGTRPGPRSPGRGPDTPRRARPAAGMAAHHVRKGQTADPGAGIPYVNRARAVVRTSTGPDCQRHLHRDEAGRCPRTRSGHSPRPRRSAGLRARWGHGVQNPASIVAQGVAVSRTAQSSSPFAGRGRRGRAGARVRAGAWPRAPGAGPIPRRRLRNRGR